MKFSVKKVILIIAGLVGLALLFILGSIAWFYLKFSPAKATLRNELHTLTMPVDYALTSSTYRHGQCLDNCPSLNATYKLNSSREAVGQTVRTALESKGYIITDYSPNTVWAKKDNISVHTKSEPSLNRAAPDYSSNLENQPVTGLTIVFNYQR